MKKVFKKILLIVLFSCFCVSSVAYADTTEELEARISSLETRVALLEKLILENNYSADNIESTVVIPDIQGMEKDDAVLLLSSKDLIPIIENQYDDIIETGKVISTYPASNSTVEKNTRITVYVSKGPFTVFSKNSSLTWNNVSYNQDNWYYRFNNPYIEGDYLYIECYPIFAASFALLPSEDKTYAGTGDASLNDTFDKTVPIKVVSDDSIVTAGVEKNFTIIVPLSQLDMERPTDLYCKLFIYMNNTSQYLNISFSIEW